MTHRTKWSQAPESGAWHHFGSSISGGVRRQDPLGGICETNSSKSVHMMGICGTGMGSLAGMLIAKGFKVTGSDENVYPPMSDQLRGMGIEIKEGYRRENIPDDTDFVVVGNVISRNNREVAGLLDRKIPYLSMPQVLSEYFLYKSYPIVVAGTHGKTTVSSLIAWILECAGESPSFLIGGVLKNFGCSYQMGEGSCFVIEGDEYDTAFFDKGPKFLHYRPHIAVLTSLEFDHADIYKDFDHIEGAFVKFVGIIPPDGSLVACSDHPSAMKVAKGAGCPIITYGLDPRSDFAADYVKDSGGKNTFKVFHKSRLLGSVVTNLSGRHNVQNILAAVAVTYGLGCGFDDTAKALLSFDGVKRRQEVRGVVGGVTVIDDFAHHPSAVRETIKGIKSRYRDGRVWAIFEPRSNTSRRKIFQDDFSKGLREADIVIVADLFHADKIPIEDRLDARKVADDVNSMGGRAFFLSKTDEIVDFVCKEGRDGDVVVVMSNGGFDNIHEKLIKGLGGAA